MTEDARDRTELGAVEGTHDPWKLKHHPWTPEGQIEGTGLLARGTLAARGWRRSVAMAVILLVLLTIVLTTISVLLR